MKPDLQTIDIQLLLHDALIFAAPAAHHKEIQLQVNNNEQLKARVDKHILETILRNLLSNAIKFTHNGGSVTLSAVSVEQEIIISVEDNGVGIPDELQHILLGPYGGHSTKGTENEKGTGLGLVLCKDLVELNGGRIWLESAEGKGTTFHFTIPENGSRQSTKTSFPLVKCPTVP